MGHGSMVASVVGTKGGVAPGVTLGAYRVFGCDGYVGDNVLIEAIDRAVRDGCDIINLSLASGSGYAETVRRFSGRVAALLGHTHKQQHQAALQTAADTCGCVERRTGCTRVTLHLSCLRPAAAQPACLACACPPHRASITV
jgi:hypothetical protein